MRKTDSSIETFVGIIVSEADLQLHGLNKLTLLAGGQELVDGPLEEVRVNFLTWGLICANPICNWPESRYSLISSGCLKTQLSPCFLYRSSKIKTSPAFL